MAHIETTSPEQAEGYLKEVYEKLIESRGKLAEIHKVQSLNPNALVTHMDFYMAIMFGKSPLKRYQREMLGVVTSVVNQCEYCIRHHEQALLAYWKDQEKTDQLITDRLDLDLSEKDNLLCDLAEKLTRNQNSDYSEDVITLKNAGFGDRAILDAVQVIAYFNFVNRLVLGLGVEHSVNEKKGYKY